MNETGLNLPLEPERFDSGDCLNMMVDVEGDNTIRPCRPELLQRMTAERDRLQRLTAEERQRLGQERLGD